MSRVVRDQRVDAIGWINDLTKLVKEPAVDEVKNALKAKKAGEAQGDVFTGLLIGAGPSLTVDPEEFHKLYVCGKIKKEEYLACLKVGVEPARKLLSAADLAKVCTDSPGTPRLNIKRIREDKGPDLAFALRSLREYLGNPVSAIAA